MLRSRLYLFGFGSSLVVVACSAAPSDEAATAGSEVSTGILSCKSKHGAEIAAARAVPAAAGWRYLQLGVMQPVAGVRSIRERLDDAPSDDPLASPLDAFALAKEAAAGNGLLSLERLVSYLDQKHGISLELDAFQTDGSYRGTGVGFGGESGNDFRRALWLAKHVFAIAEAGVTDADVVADAKLQAKAAAAYKTVTVPIATPDGHGSTLDQLVDEAKSGNGRFFCATPWANGLRTLARAADTKFGNDGETSLSELAIYLSEKYDASITLENGTFGVTYPSSAQQNAAYSEQQSFACAVSAFNVASRERVGVTPIPSPGVALGLTQCGELDLLALQGHGTRYTGSTATAVMGEKQYEIVMLSASVLQPKIRELLCLEPQDELKLYVPYNQNTITECGLVNGVYTAKHYGLTGYGYTDNWAAE